MWGEGRHNKRAAHGSLVGMKPFCTLTAAMVTHTTKPHRTTHMRTQKWVHAKAVNSEEALLCRLYNALVLTLYYSHVRC